LADIDPNEKLTRYLFEKSDIRKDGSLHWRALIPNKEGETSVFRISECSEGDVWVMGFPVAKTRGKVLIGRGDLIASNVLEVSLTLRRDEDARSRHADIIGWPEEKDRRQAIAIDLAEKVEPKKL
jgi:hypothetical protein